LIAEEVQDAATHQRRVADPDGYRPAACPRCGQHGLHRHDLRTRKPGTAGGGAEVFICRFRCPDAACGAVWQVLPAFLPRHLWRRWAVIEATVPRPPGEPAPAAPRPPRDPPVPPRTVQRWHARLTSAARRLIQLLATMGSAALDDLAAGLGLDATRADLVAGYAVRFAIPPGRHLAAVAGHVHRIEPGLRLM